MMTRMAKSTFVACTWAIGMLAAANVAAAQENLLGLPDKAVASKGTLVICGGGKTPDEVYAEVVKLAGGNKARLVLIPSAYRYSGPEHVQRRFSSWKEYKTASLDFLDAKTREEADKPEFIKPLEQATGVWIAGGYQGRLSDLYAGTKAEAAIRGVLERGGVVGGISAGAAVMSKVMIRYGTSTGAKVDRGFGLLQNAVVDQHFTQRNRLGRLLDAMKQNPGLTGLGVDEGTALVVSGNRLRVLGNSEVTICTGPEVSQTTLHRLKPNDEAVLAAINAAVKGGKPQIVVNRVRQ